MRTTRVRSLGLSLLLFGLLLCHASRAEALPKGGTCKGPVPDGAFTCENNGGTVWCDAGGTYMCCVKNQQGGHDCEQIESKAGGQLGGMRAPSGNLQMSPGVSTTPPPTRVPKTGVTTAPIMRRGVEGEPTDSPTANPSEGASETK